MTSVFENWSGGFCPYNLGAPRFGPGGGVIHRVVVNQSVIRATRESFDHMQILARPMEWVPAIEIRRVDHERVAFPVAARVAEPEFHAFGRMRAVVGWNNTYVVNHFLHDCDVSGTLHDL